MRSTVLNTTEDLDWVCETHLKIKRPAWLTFAILRGTEDVPDCVDLYNGTEIGLARDLVYRVTFPWYKGDGSPPTLD